MNLLIFFRKFKYQREEVRLYIRAKRARIFYGCPTKIIESLRAIVHRYPGRNLKLFGVFDLVGSYFTLLTFETIYP